MNDYIKYCVAKCRARNMLFYSKANCWGRVRWAIGIINGLISASVAVLSFIAEKEGWNTNDIGVLGGLLLTVSTTIITSINAGKYQSENEQAGDAYSNLENKILTQFSSLSSEADRANLHKYCSEKIESYTNKYDEPSPEKCAELEKEAYKTIFTLTV